ncbi:MAG: hypothetical protein QS748_01355 [Candidatus Endonucleobacter bathymodioli]|uniref:Uncharacterized protein n=1 Tax=Candidatus Endonucleibacter bathymodioli TaxID=539814 RepID=A0AA90NJW8_9GAMM|nr:hypothetical protein [Candidatus Endonucleobacter bathymodioli]
MKKKLRGATCSANMLKKFMVSHAKLKNMHQHSVTSLEPWHDKSLSDEWKKEIGSKKEYFKEII